MLEPKSPVLYYLQRLRDEAHRFAIGTHRIKRKLDMAKNPLDEIEGIGAARKRARCSTPSARRRGREPARQRRTWRRWRASARR